MSHLPNLHASPEGCASWFESSCPTEHHYLIMLLTKQHTQNYFAVFAVWFSIPQQTTKMLSLEKHYLFPLKHRLSWLCWDMLSRNKTRQIMGSWMLHSREAHIFIIASTWASFTKSHCMSKRVGRTNAKLFVEFNLKFCFPRFTNPLFVVCMNICTNGILFVWIFI